MLLLAKVMKITEGKERSPVNMGAEETVKKKRTTYTFVASISCSLY